MSSYGVKFAANGDPNGIGLPKWSPFDPALLTVMEVGDWFAPMPLADPIRFDFLKRFFQGQPAW